MNDGNSGSREVTITKRNDKHNGTGIGTGTETVERAHVVPCCIEEEDKLAVDMIADLLGCERDEDGSYVGGDLDGLVAIIEDLGLGYGDLDWY